MILLLDRYADATVVTHSLNLQAAHPLELHFLLPLCKLAAIQCGQVAPPAVTPDALLAPASPLFRKDAEIVIRQNKLDGPL